MTVIRIFCVCPGIRIRTDPNPSAKIPFPVLRLPCRIRTVTLDFRNLYLVTLIRYYLQGPLSTQKRPPEGGLLKI